MEPRPVVPDTRPELTWASHAWRYALCLLFSAAVWQTVAAIEWREERPLFAAEVTLGVAAFVLVHFRRRAPVRVALVIAAMSAFSGLAAGPATLAAVSVATRRRSGEVVLVGTTNFVAAQTWTTIAPIPGNDPLVTTLVNLTVNAGMMGWGLYIGSRRELLWSLRSRAERAELEQELRLAQARSTERTRIAREMHDVLAHRITQVSMHAGALAFRDDLAGDRLREGLGQIQRQANDALHELRDVLGVLREDDPGTSTARPQPTYDDIGALVAEEVSLGMHIDWSDDVDAPTPVPPATGRALYRIVQEGITNVRKHAPGSGVEIRSSGDPGRGITLVVSNPVARATGETPGAGLGLVGLRERAELRGGRLRQRREGSRFVLEAWLPWSA
ncbi:two-component sensor histidine kinase [Nocardioides flavus (ex Wang et al. 2016)]|uniref:histidine kinase n=1 Tax=Nocardioides flavus (ex Wang et al. 2016) TaxID=2058780 RepID=A0ABQ3HNQ3_9ACTN|nr:histidine kinase [Nocardioides flavus (ex Wang et al. 2016)]GHE17749.1 two-component sensor histidine kinase [Nocardioides flavus (ex Wang et al. 2016)]